MNKISMKKKGFTLVELLIVIAIIGILFIVLISKVDFATDKAKETGVQTDFRSFQTAMETVAREHQGFDCLVGDADANGTKGEAEEDFALLIYELNKNLDPKLRVEYVDVATETEYAAGGAGAAPADLVLKTVSALDPWKEPYVAYYHMGDEANATGDGMGNRGSISFVSMGANMDNEVLWAQRTDASLNASKGAGWATDGEYVRDAANAKADDYVITTIYTFENLYGEVLSTSQGFSNNQIAAGDTQP